MEKKIGAALRKHFQAFMREHYAEFKKVKMPSGSSFTSCDLYERRLDEKKAVWMVFGPEKDSDDFVVAAIGWTSCGEDFLKLAHWDCDRDQSLPDSGMLMLTDRELHGISEEAMDALRVDEPCPDVINRAYAAYSKSAIGQRVRIMIAKEFDLEPSDPKVEAELRGGQLPMLRLWGEVAKYVELEPSEIDSIITPVIRRVEQLVLQYGMPFLNRAVGA